MWTFEDQEIVYSYLQIYQRFYVWFVGTRIPQMSFPLIAGSKATGVQKVIEKLGLKPENLLVFGDELNDLELFDYAGMSIAMKGLASKNY